MGTLRKFYDMMGWEPDRAHLIDAAREKSQSTRPGGVTSRMIIRTRDDAMTERAVDSLVGKNRFDLAWAKVREQNKDGLRWVEGKENAQ